MNGEMQSFLNRLSRLSAETLIRAALAALLGYVLVRLILRLLSRAFGRGPLEPSLAHMLLTVCRLGLYFLLFTVVMGQLGVSSSSFVTLLGVFGLALSLAMQDTLANIAGGIFVMYTKPFKAGDYVELCGAEGTVRLVGFIHTTLATVDNKLIYVPNGQLSKGNIVNYSAEGRRQLELTVGIGYEDDTAAARQLIQDVIAADPRVDQSRPIFVKVWELADSAVAIRARAWTAGQDMIETRCDLYEAVKDALLMNGFHIPYPQRQITVEKGE